MNIASSSIFNQSQYAETLRRYFGTISRDAAESLVGALGQGPAAGMDPLSADMLALLLHDIGLPHATWGRRSAGVRDILFRGLEGLIDDLPAGARLLPGGLALADLEAVWIWLVDHLLPAEFDLTLQDLRVVMLSGDQGRIGQALAATRRLLGQALRVGLAEETPSRALLATSAGSRALETASAWMKLLEAEASAGLTDQRLPIQIAEFTEEMAQAAATLHRRILAERPDRSVEFLLLVLARLVRPWQIFRLVQKITTDFQEDKMMCTEIGLVVERVLAQLERWVALFREATRNGVFEPEVLALALDRFGQALAGFRREATPRLDGRLDRRLRTIATSVGETMDELMKRAAPALAAAVPRENTRGAGRAMVEVLAPAKRLDHDKLAIARRLLRLVAATRLTARAAAFGGERDMVERRLEPELAAIQDVALRSLHDPALRPDAIAWLEAIDSLYGAFHGPEAAAILRRRMAAA